MGGEAERPSVDAGQRGGYTVHDKTSVRVRKDQPLSWDVLLMQVPSNILRSQDLAKNFRSQLGPRPEILSILTQICPGIDFSDPGWGIFEGNDFSIEFNLGDTDPVESVMLHVRGSDNVISIIRNICEYTGWRALDTSIGDFIDFDRNPTTGLQQWRTFRDRVFASLETEGEKVARDARVSTLEKKKRWWQFWK